MVEQNGNCKIEGNNKWNIDNLMKSLKNIYVTKKDDQVAWNEEKTNIEKQLNLLSNYLHEDYQDPEILDRGGSGIIIKISYARLHKQKRVLKFPRPLPKDAPEFARLLDNEIKLLAKIRFRSIVAIHEAGKVPSTEEIAGLDYVPFYVMDFIDGQDSDIYYKQNSTTFEKFIRMFNETVKAITHLHKNNIVHLDIKPGNIRIDNSNYPVLVDLGTTKVLSQEDFDTKIATTIRYAPREMARYLIKNPKDESRAEGTLKRNQIKLIWDLHFLGLTLQELINIILEKNHNAFTTYQRKYLYLLSIRMLQDPLGENELKNFGLPPNLLYEIKYNNIKTVLNDVGKILPESDLGSNIPEFDQNHHASIQIGGNDSLTLTERVSDTINHAFLRRLAEISHLGIVQLVYPTCTHSRFEHSLGTYHNVIKYIRALYYDPLNPLFRQIMEPVNIRAALLSAILHDIGQFPMAHDLEDVDGKIFNHSSLVTSLINGVRDEKVKGSRKMTFPPLDDIFRLWQVQKKDVLSILEAKIDTPSHGIRQRILKSLISGPIDADKLDYLLRDSVRLNVPYPKGIDVERLLRCLTILIKTHADGVLAYVVVHEKGRIPAEFVILSRYAMYAQVYWHHSVRAAKGMLARALRSLITSFTTQEEKNRFKSDFEHFVLFRLGNKTVEDASQLSLFQFDDNPSEDDIEEREQFKGSFTGTALNAWDVATLNYIKSALDEKELAEAEIIDDIINRRLYKRAFIYEAQSDSNVWNGLIDQWDKMNSEEKVTAERKIENAIVSSIGKKLEQNPDTLYLTEEQRKSIELRVKAGLPLIIVDVPAHKPGSRKALEYILEEDRRALRKSNQICGGSCVDKVWKEYAGHLRENAGRIRVYIHFNYVDAVLAAVDKSWMGEVLENLSGIQVEKSLYED